MLVAIVISLGVMGGINENKCDYNLQEATVAMTYAAGTGEYGPEAIRKVSCWSISNGKSNRNIRYLCCWSRLVSGRLDSRSRSRSSRIIKK